MKQPIKELSEQTPLVVYKGHVYQLKPKTKVAKGLKEEVEKTKAQTVLVDNSTGIVFELVPVADTGALESLVENNIKEEVIASQSDVVKENIKLKKFIDIYKTLLEQVVPGLDRDMGIIEREGRIFVYLSVEPYVLKSQSTGRGNASGRYFLFPETKVGLEVVVNRGDSLTVNGTPIVLGRYSHPFAGTDKVDSGLCFGGNTIADEKYQRLESLGEKIAYVLKKTKYLLQSGYLEGVTPVCSVENCENRDGVRRVSSSDLQELARRKIYVTNENIQHG